MKCIAFLLMFSLLSFPAQVAAQEFTTNMDQFRLRICELKLDTCDYSLEVTEDAYEKTRKIAYKCVTTLDEIESEPIYSKYEFWGGMLGGVALSALVIILGYEAF